MGHLSGGRDDSDAWALEEGAGVGATEGAGVDNGEGAVTGGSTAGWACECADGGGGKASFLRIKTSRSSCFNWSSTISLESTNL